MSLAIAIALLTAISFATVAVIAYDLHRLPGRLLVRAVEAYLHRIATAAHDDQEPTP